MSWIFEFKEKMKQVFLPLLLSVAASTHAGTIGSIDVADPKWALGADSLYMQPNFGNINYRGLQRTSAQDTNHATHPLPYLWGFKVYGSYSWDDASDVNLEWYRIKKSISKDFGGLLSGAGDPLSEVYGDITPNWNAVNMEFGYTSMLSDKNSARFHVGLEYAQILTDEKRYVVLATGVPNSATINRFFNGVGARVGANFTHHFINNFDVYGNVATAILAGKHSSDTTYAALYSNRHVSVSAIVPELEAKLGAKYTYYSTRGALTLNAGWMWINYFNSTVFDNYNLLYDTVNTTSTDFALQGLFFGLKWTPEFKFQTQNSTN
ncbi:MAG: Lpg1974 family pore-forming outer membrane protein [Legionella sp.]|nr:Lpg1974 family pore-forming outer membrane protein [Legionella sp.]